MKRFLRWKIVLPIFLAGVLAVIALVVGGGWYVADVLENDGLLPDHDDPELDMVVDAIGDGRLTLRVTSETSEDGPWIRDGLWGLKSASGYGQVGRILEISGQHVVREYTPLTGTLRNGEMVHVDSSVFPVDPEEAFGLPFEDVSFSSPLGDLDAWFVDGSNTTWVIFVHGRENDRREALRMLPTVVDAGHPSLLITYRNDEDAPADPSGYYQYGWTEWEDLEGASAYAVEHGAEDLVLVGYSMGGAIVVNFLYRSPLADKVRGVILDAPMINFSDTVELGASERGLPGPLVAVAKSIASQRFGIDWGELNYLSRADELDTPILLFHGDQDDVVPMETSDALSKARPDIVKYVSFAGAPHVGAWNVDRARYEATVSDFLQSLGRNE